MNCLRIEGAKVGMLEVIRFVGYNRTSSVFECRCECGSICYRRGPHLTFTRNLLAAGKVIDSKRGGYRVNTNCGCQSRRVPANSRDLHRKYFGILKGGPWEDRVSFHWECCAKKPAAPGKLKGWHLVRWDTSRPAGPDNFFWCLSHEIARDTYQRGVAAIATLSKIPLRVAAKRAAGLSRQRIKQITNRLRGGCAWCAERRATGGGGARDAEKRSTRPSDPPESPSHWTTCSTATSTKSASILRSHEVFSCCVAPSTKPGRD